MCTFEVVRKECVKMADIESRFQTLMPFSIGMELFLFISVCVVVVTNPNNHIIRAPWLTTSIHGAVYVVWDFPVCICGKSRMESTTDTHTHYLSHTHTTGGCTSRIGHWAIVLYHVHSTIGGYYSCTCSWPNDLCWRYASIYCSWWWFWPRFTYS